MPTRFISILSATTSALATDTRPPPKIGTIALYKIRQTQALHQRFNPKIRFMAWRRIADGNLSFGHALSASSVPL